MSKFIKEELLLNSAKILGEDVAKITTPLTPQYCGYVGLIIKPARGKFVSYLKSLNIGSRGVYGGYELSTSDFIETNTQSIEIKVAAMNKVAQLLQANGIKCRVREYAL